MGQVVDSAGEVRCFQLAVYLLPSLSRVSSQVTFLHLERGREREQESERGEGEREGTRE